MSAEELAEAEARVALVKAATEIASMSGQSLSDATGALLHATTWKSPAEVADITAEALEAAAQDWGYSTWRERWERDGVADDASAVRSTVNWLRERAATIREGEPR